MVRNNYNRSPRGHRGQYMGNRGRGGARGHGRGGQRGQFSRGNSGSFAVARQSQFYAENRSSRVHFSGYRGQGYLSGSVQRQDERATLVPRNFQFESRSSSSGHRGHHGLRPGQRACEFCGLVFTPTPKWNACPGCQVAFQKIKGVCEECNLPHSEHAQFCSYCKKKVKGQPGHATDKVPALKGRDGRNHDNDDDEEGPARRAIAV